MEKECLNCGAKFIAQPKTKPKLYCSDKCRCGYWYKKRYERQCPPERISECEYCGVEFDNCNNPKRKYCCRAHYEAARNVLLSEVVKHNRNKSTNPSKSFTLAVQSEAQPPEAFLEIGIHELPQATMRRIFLLCGVSRFTGKFDSFAMQIPQALSYNLQIGDVFVFCNKSRYQLSVLQWQGDGFVLMFRRTEQERYPWPFSVDAKAVEISRSDLEMLLEYPRFMRRLKGLATPEFLT